MKAPYPFSTKNKFFTSILYRKLKQSASELFLVCSLLITVTNAVAIVPDSANYVRTGPEENAFPLLETNHAAPLLISSTDYAGVQRAFTDLQNDFYKVCGILPDLFTDQTPTGSVAIIAGTLGKSTLINGLVEQGKIDTTGLSGKWEKFLIQTVASPLAGIDEALVIVGSDKRGTIFGIYDLSEKIGVSPWYYWADVPIQTKNQLYIKSGLHYTDAPAVKYRGIFLNDEDPALSGWVNMTFGKFNHQFYEKLFELILRLKGNFLWPAMWGKSLFEDDPESDDLADEYGVVIGTTHHEPMHRAHVDWSRHGTGDWNYETNDAVLREFWREGIERMGNKEALVTVGMRGDGDEAMTSGTAIPLLERIVADQRTILEEVSGKPAEETPQVWALYKEVQDYYDQGMTVPDDVTLLFADDNWGNIRRLPDVDAPKRKGGYGVYYHFDYVGGPRSYRWLNTNPLPRIWEQMNLAYEHGVETIWIVNVGDLKPMEFPISFFLDMAWAPKTWTADKIDDYSTLWAEQQFGKEHAAPIADYLARYGKYNGRRKPELLSAETYSLTNFNEAEGVLNEYKTLEQEVDSVGSLLSDELQDAYFQLVEHPVDACSNLLDMYITLEKNKLYSFQGRASANAYGEKVRELFDKDAAITDYYHTQLADGKWNHMMAQDHIGYTSWAAPGRNIRPSVNTINVPGKANMGVVVSGEEGFWPGIKNLTIHADAIHEQAAFIEIFNRGKAPFNYQLEYDTSYVTITPEDGIIAEEQRLEVNIHWEKAPLGVDTLPVKIHGPEEQEATIFIRAFKPESSELSQFEGFIENNGFISMEANHYAEEVNSASDHWLIVPDMGRTGSGITTMPTTSESVTPGGNSPHVTYPVYFFASGQIKVTAYLSPTINYLARPEGMRYAVSFDESNPKVISFNGDTDSGRANNIIVSTSTHQISEAGPHILKYWMVDPGVVLQKIVIETGTSKSSYLGAPEQAYALSKELFVNAAKIIEGDSSRVRVKFSETLNPGSIDTDDFSFYSEEDLNEIKDFELTEGNQAIVFSLQDVVHTNQLLTFNYVPGTLKSENERSLRTISDYIVQLGAYEDEAVGDDPNIYFEVEDGTVGSNWERHADGFASNSAYLMTKAGHENVSAASSNEDDWISITFKVCDPGQHTFWARANTPSPNDDSFWVKMDEGNWIQWNNIRAGSGWAWDNLGETFSLDTGYHTVLICMREDGAGIDKICLSKSTQPSGLGGTYTECDNTVGITELMNGALNHQARIYPIPVENDLYIQSHTAFNELIIYDVSGKEKFLKQLPHFSTQDKLNVKNLKPGVYFISINNTTTQFREMHRYLKK